MNSNHAIRQAVRQAIYVGAMATAVGYATTGNAQQAADIEEITVTGTRITVPGVESASPIYSVGADEIQLQQQPEVERILRLLPITKPDDGQNVNNGTVGVASINLRGLGEQRNLVMIDGKRVTPYNTNGIIDTSVIPTALIDRIDIITGGASAVYGSDAISGALNFIMKRDFEGVDLRGY
jgi:outer membrane cobalamin receptor